MIPTALDSLRAGGVLLALVLCFASCVSSAASPMPDGLEISLVAEVRQEVELSPGRRVVRLMPAQVLRQGQEIFYTVRIRNTSATPAPNVEVVQRIPQNTSYVSNS